MRAQQHRVRQFNANAKWRQVIFLTCFLPFDFQAQCESQKEREHRECCLEVQRLCAQLEETQGRLHSQELDLERLRPLEVWLGQYQKEQQVSRMVGTYTSSVYC